MLSGCVTLGITPVSNDGTTRTMPTSSDGFSAEMSSHIQSSGRKNANQR